MRGANEISKSSNIVESDEAICNFETRKTDCFAFRKDEHMTNFTADQTFKNQNYTQTRLPKGEYENCIFEGCNFENGYLDNQNFMECEFIDCNLSNANLAHTIFNPNYSRFFVMKSQNTNRIGKRRGFLVKEL